MGRKVAKTGRTRGRSPQASLGAIVVSPSTPESRRARLARLLRSRPAVRKPGVSFAELLDLYRSAFPDDLATHDSLTSALGALLHDGTVVRSGRKRGRTYYAAAPDGRVRRPSERERSTLAAAVVEIVRAHYRAERRPISTAGVRNALKTRGLWPDRYARLATLLHALAKAPARESGTDPVPRPALKVAPARRTAGRVAAFWIPVEAPDQPALEPPDRAEALRRAVAIATEQLGRPVTKTELRWWLDTQPPSSMLGLALGDGPLGPAIKNTLDHDRRHEGDTGRLHDITGALTVNGGAPVRRRLGPPTPNDVSASALEDAVSVVRARSESTALQRFEGWRKTAVQSIPGRKVLDRIASDRRSLVLHALRVYAGLSENELVDAMARMRSTHTVASRWLDEASISYAARYTRREQLAQAIADLSAVERLLDDRRSSSRIEARIGQLRFVGQTALVPPRTMREFARRTVDAGEIDATRPRTLYTSARRVPNPGRPARPAIDELALIDRLDAVVAVVEAANAPRGRALVSVAHDVIGHALRDAAYLSDRLDDVAPGDHEIRSALVIALGLLGELPDIGLAVPNRRNALESRAYVLAALLATLDAGQAESQLAEAADWVRGAAGQILEKALAKARRGMLVSLLE